MPDFTGEPARLVPPKGEPLVYRAEDEFAVKHAKYVVPSYGNGATYMARDGFPVISLPPDMWVAMGRPAEITLTIEPGNTLS